MTRNPQDELPLTPAVFHILLTLADGEKHGYAIMQEVEQETNGAMTLGPGTLYGSIKRLLKAGLIVETDERPDPEIDDQRRRYYQMTDWGRRVLKAEVEYVRNLIRIAQMKHVFSEG